MKNNAAKTLVLVILTGIAIPSKAHPASAPHSGFYLGAALGGADLTAKNNLFLNRLAPVNIPISQNSYLTPTDKNIAGDIFLGYENRIHCFSLEGEVTGSFARLNANPKLGITTDDIQSLEIKTTYAVGGFFKLGYYMHATTKLYLKMGFEFRNFKVNFTDPSNIFVSVHKSYTSTAFVPGLGMEVELTPRLSLRTEYRVALHPQKTVQAANSATQNTTVQTKPTIHYLNIGLVFKM